MKVASSAGPIAGLRAFALSVAILLASGLVATRAGAQQAGPQPSQAHPASAAPAAQEAPDVPASPLVSYAHGQLTIVAENATISQVLSALHNTMGTEVEVPAGSSGERVWVHIGPGSAHKVLSELFANTDLDYILQGSPTDPNAIRVVTLSVRSPDGKSGPAGEESASGPRRPRFLTNAAPAPDPEPEPAPAPQEASAAPASAAPSTQPAPADSTAAAASQTPPAPEIATPAPVQAGMEPTGTPNIFPETPQPSSGAFNPHPSPPPTMSTDQMVQQLTNMYQQRRQMQAGQSSSTPN